ncbi:hypothetical protein N7510_002534 [Penicillium lagena]|uniref:uncharacterized protein n=1 Tax=Penicillium lagena TaxID=94218 RepID=UPI002541055F|nr:uncharacterized protein N7510_002534 [Penicillium lagena]KAJ5626225.1 hypothetical protein N7510_002534 [Penicillium lagena]
MLYVTHWVHPDAVFSGGEIRRGANLQRSARSSSGWLFGAGWKNKAQSCLNERRQASIPAPTSRWALNIKYRVATSYTQSSTDICFEVYSEHFHPEAPSDLLYSDGTAVGNVTGFFKMSTRAYEKEWEIERKLWRLTPFGV